MNDRFDEAWAIVLKLHADGKDPEAEDVHFATEEFYQMRRQVAADKAMASQETLMTLFTKPSYRKRMICGFLTMYGAESTGILVIYSTFNYKFPRLTPANLLCRLQCAIVRRTRLHRQLGVDPGGGLCHSGLLR